MTWNPHFNIAAKLELALRTDPRVVSVEVIADDGKGLPEDDPDYGKPDYCVCVTVSDVRYLRGIATRVEIVADGDPRLTIRAQ